MRSGGSNRAAAPCLADFLCADLGAADNYALGVRIAAFRLAMAQFAAAFVHSARACVAAVGLPSNAPKALAVTTALLGCGVARTTTPPAFAMTGGLLAVMTKVLFFVTAVFAACRFRFAFGRFVGLSALALVIVARILPGAFGSLTVTRSGFSLRHGNNRNGGNQYGGECQSCNHFVLLPL